MGYAGGSTNNPTYHNLADHTETIQIDYDPGVIGYDELLAYFFAAHNPLRTAFSRQYKSIIFVHDAEQERAARAAVTAMEARTGHTVQTDIVTVWEFHRAEGYHQKYALQGEKGILEEFGRMYPEFVDIVDSTAAARVNGFLYGCGSPDEVRRLGDDLGLSPEAVGRLLRGLGG